MSQNIQLNFNIVDSLRYIHVSACEQRKNDSLLAFSMKMSIFLKTPSSGHGHLSQSSGCPGILLFRSPNLISENNMLASCLLPRNLSFCRNYYAVFRVSWRDLLETRALLSLILCRQIECCYIQCKFYSAYKCFYKWVHYQTILPFGNATVSFKHRSSRFSL